MTRALSGQVTKNKHKKILKLAKGYRGRRNSCYRIALQTVEKALQYAYRDRRNRKRDFRGLWIQRINAAARDNGLIYSTLMAGMKRIGIDIDRKILADLAVNDPAAFTEVAERVKASVQTEERSAA